MYYDKRRENIHSDSPRNIKCIVCVFYYYNYVVHDIYVYNI